MSAPLMIRRALYVALLILAYPFIVAKLLWRGLRDCAYRPRRRERFGRLAGDVPADVVWIHAVSAGEVVAATPLLRGLIAALPERRFLLTTMTPTGLARAESSFGAAALVCYAPYDFPWTVRRFLNHVRPRVLVLIETELWPNMIRQCAERGVAVVLANARLSVRSARGYRAIGGLTREMLGHVAWIAAQYPDHVRRFVELGAIANRIDAVGTLKFDGELPPDLETRGAALRDRWQIGDRPVWIAASTHAGEDEQIVAAHLRVLAERPNALLILVPRHPRRFDAAAATAARHCRTVRMSTSSGPLPEVLVGDAMGQLIYLYGVAHVAFIGGSLVRHGGHNPIEAAAVGLPLLVGPHDFNFADVTAKFADANCLHRVTDEASLAAALLALFQDPTRRAAESDRARGVVAANRGAAVQIVARLREIIERP